MFIDQICLIILKTFTFCAASNSATFISSSFVELRLDVGT